MILSLHSCYLVCVILTHHFVWSSSARGNAIENPKQTYNNLTKAPFHAIRSNREADEDDDEFPIVHDYFYETEEGYPGEGREFSGDFEPLCHNIRRRVELKSDVYDYYPPHYVETVCRKFTSSGGGEFSRSTYNQCSHPGFRCVQRTQTIYVTRRKYDSECWETTKEKIASGCDCMWPGRSLRIKNK